jgi:membrane protein required for colicin V production
MFWYDICIVAIIAAGFLYGFFKGIISEIFAIAGLVIGLIVAMKYSFLIQPYLLRFVKGETAALCIGFILLFLITAAAIIFIGILFKKAIKFIRLSWLDRWVGGMVGIVKGVIIVGLISLIVVALFPDGKTFMKQSRFGRHTITIVRIAVYLLPERFRKKLGGVPNSTGNELTLTFPSKISYSRTGIENV